MNEQMKLIALDIADAFATDGSWAAYAYTVGVIRSFADPGTGSAMTDTERLAAIRGVLEALDQAKEAAQ